MQLAYELESCSEGHKTIFYPIQSINNFIFFFWGGGSLIPLLTTNVNVWSLLDAKCNLLG
jgi:hypothetical protein